MNKMEETAARAKMEKRGLRCHLHPDIVLESGSAMGGRVESFTRPCPQCLIEAVEEYKSQVKECECER